MILLRDIGRIIIITNTILAFYIVFHRRRSVSTTWAWLIILLVFPVLGMIIYGFFGRGISQENIFAINKQHHIGLRNVQKSITAAPKKISTSDTSNKAKMVIHFFDHDGESPLSKNNHVKLYTDGEIMFHDMMRDIKKAKQSVNVEFYTFYNDEIGNDFLDLLIQKAQEGVSVRLLYDAWGSMGATKAWFDQ
ncbi:MAG: PLDc N-terminal domain-containing protein, partial [Lactobacillus sp.]|nr:PLDc N-terminal domain-containing protein [Lactobacillus sp.]